MAQEGTWRWTHRAGLALATILLAGLAIEAGLAIWAPQVYQLPGVWEFDETLGWRHRAGVSGRLRTPEFDVTYHIDAEGLRVPATAGEAVVPDHDESAPAIEPPVQLALYGDSFAEGWGVEARQSVASQLADTIAQRQRSARVSNYGTAGYGTDQQLLLYTTIGRSRDSDIVLVLFYCNDLWNNASPRAIGVERGDKPYFTLEPDGLLRLQGVPVRRHPHWDRPPSSAWTGVSHVASLISTSLRPARLPTEEQSTYYGALFGRPTEIDAATNSSGPLWELTCRLLGSFHDAVAADGRKFVIVYAPSILQIEPHVRAQRLGTVGGAAEYDMMKPNRLLASWAVREQVAFLDLTPAFLQHREEGGDLFYDDSHWRPEGHRVAATEIADFLDQVGWLH